jgi:hypothetical protein
MNRMIRTVGNSTARTRAVVEHTPTLSSTPVSFPCIRRIVLDFEGRRLQGARPFAVFETKDGAWTWHSGRSHFPYRNGAGNVLGEVQAALRWCREHLSIHVRRLVFCRMTWRDKLNRARFSLRRSTATSIFPMPDWFFYEELHSAPIEYSQSAATSSRSEGEIAAQGRVSTRHERIHNYIAAGDIYQANFTQRFRAPLPCPPAELYDRLRAAHSMRFRRCYNGTIFRCLPIARTFSQIRGQHAHGATDQRHGTARQHAGRR